MTQPTVEDSVDEKEPKARFGMLVGLDGSNGSLHAIRWAARRVEEFGPIQPILTWHVPWWAYSGPMLPPTEHFKQTAEKTVDEALATIDSGQCLSPIVSRSQAGQTLVEVGETATLIVVGTRGRSGLKDRMLGSVSSYVAAHATTPVAVIPPTAALDNPHGKVVVAIDGSVNSMRALTWAVRHCQKDAVIEAVHAWSYPASAMPDLAVIPENVYEEQARFTLNEAVSAVSRATGTRGHKILKQLEYGDPRLVLKERSEACDMLVVGARGSGGLQHLLLGSVATALIHQPTVPTVIIPLPDD